jgi:type III pantothenate kinase
MTVLLIDIGNTRLKWALHEAVVPGSAALAQGAVFLETIEQLGDGDWRGLQRPSAVIGCCVASDQVRHRVRDQIDELFDLQPRWAVAAQSSAGVVNGYDHPSRLGADRWVALIGARWRLTSAPRPVAMSDDPPGKAARRSARTPPPADPAVVVMAGTAVTCDALDAEGRFLGGCILPGHGIMLKALESGTAGLHVPTGEVRAFPTNTSDALTSGGTYAITGAIEHMHRNLARHAGVAPRVLLTGGAGWKVAPYLGIGYELVDSLIFDGLLRLQQWRQEQGEG